MSKSSYMRYFAKTLVLFIVLFLLNSAHSRSYGFTPASLKTFKDGEMKAELDSLTDPEFQALLNKAKEKGIPLMDLHVHLKGGLTKERALQNAGQYGFTYGIAYNCGLDMGFESDDSLRTFVRNYEKPGNTYLAMQAEGREWTEMFSPETVALFDYVFTDSMTWTNNRGKRMRLWIPEETEIGDPEDFMDQLVDRIEAVLNNEPIDIYVNATYLPDLLSSRYDLLWTPERMDRVIEALKKNNIAMEISARYRIPSEDFIKRAKNAGVLFTFGTNNTGANDLGRLEYCLEMAEKCELVKENFWVPEPRQ